MMIKSPKERLEEALDLVARLRRSRADVKELREEVSYLKLELAKAQREITDLNWVLVTIETGYLA